MLQNNPFTETMKTINVNKIKDNSKHHYNVLSLFSGCGGMDLGFKGGFTYLDNYFNKNQFNLVFANDIFKQAADVYEANFKLPVERRSIEELDEYKDLPDTDIDVILGGFPCQSFSLSGKRKGLSDPRGILYRQMIKVIMRYMPKMFIAENVDGIRNSRKNQEGVNVDETALNTILHDFEKVGYNVQYHVLLAANYGVPQMRKRVIIEGIRKDLGNNNDVFYPEISRDKTGDITGNKWLTAKDGIDDLWDKVNSPEVANHTTRDISKAKFYPGRKMQGNNKIKADYPSPTIRAEHHGNIEAHYRTYGDNPDDMKNWRRLSVRECARLQSFPDEFVFNCSASSAYKAIGNAVPPVLAWHIAKGVEYSLNRLLYGK